MFRAPSWDGGGVSCLDRGIGLSDASSENPHSFSTRRKRELK